jgi:hypothetical protein
MTMSKEKKDKEGKVRLTSHRFLHKRPHFSHVRTAEFLYSSTPNNPTFPTVWHSPKTNIPPSMGAITDTTNLTWVCGPY